MTVVHEYKMPNGDLIVVTLGRDRDNNVVVQSVVHVKEERTALSLVSAAQWRE